MLLVGYSLFDVVTGVLYVSLIGTVVYFLYKRLLRRLSKGAIDKEDFCVLYALEEDPTSGEIEFYFTTEEERGIKLSILNANMDEIQVVTEKTATTGGNIVRFDSNTLSNGKYFFCLTTENQKTMKKMTILNG